MQSEQHANSIRPARLTASAVLLIVATVGCALAGGCGGNELETGYAPNKLGATATERRAFYAPAFTPESQAKAMERDQELDARRPRPGY